MGGGRGGLPDTKSGGWAVHFRSNIRKVGGGGGGAIRFRSITKSGGGGGSNVSSPIGVWGKAPEASQAGTHTT